MSDKKIQRAEGTWHLWNCRHPKGFKLTDNQERVRNAVVAGEPWVGPDLKNRLGEIRWPAYYLDFETMMTALPLYRETAPYTQIPTQYSIHKCNSIGHIDAHLEYLSDPRRDSRYELAKSLIKDLESDGTIVTYSNFEKTVVTILGTLFPDLAVELERIKGRMFDLQALITANYYHPAFHGTTSVKSTLPALLPEMSYETLNIRDGDSASASFAYMAMGRYTEQEMEKIMKDLLAYCAQDTLAMVKLHERLAAS